MGLSDFEQATARFDRLGAWEAAGRLISQVSNLANPLPSNVKEIVKAASKNRWFDIAEAIASAAAGRADATPAIRRFQAQMLLERGFTEEALARLNALLLSGGLTPADQAQAMGHIGRIYKDRFVEAANLGDEEKARECLKKALDAYLGWYEKDRTSVWHGINGVALLSRPESGRKLEAQNMARAIAEEASRQTGNPYGPAILAEAAVAVDDPGGALGHLRAYLNASVFDLGALLRQFRDVWRLDRSPLVELLIATMLGREGAVVNLSAKELKDQAVFGSDLFESVVNYRRGLERCSCVARIGRTADTGVGTGFVIPGKLVSPRLGDGMVLLTNAHVISETDSNAVHPTETVVTFAAMDGVEPDQEFGIAKIHFASPREQLDVFIASLTEPVAPKSPYAVATVLPAANAPVRVIGHPSGRGLSLSVNQLLDHEEPKLHYRTATEGGSSGSPVFNQDWKLIGIHHAGGEAVPRLKGQPGTYQANEGIWIRAIAKAIERGEQ